MVYRPKSLLERLELLRQYGADLTQWRDLSLDDYLRSRTTRYAVERLLFLVAGTVLDMLDHVLSARHVKMNCVFRALTRELEMLVESGDAG